MSDEQMRLLQEILAAVKEQTALLKQQRDVAVPVPRRKNLPVRGMVVSAFMLLAGVLVLASLLRAWSPPDYSKPITPDELRNHHRG